MRKSLPKVIAVGRTQRSNDKTQLERNQTVGDIYCLFIHRSDSDIRPALAKFYGLIYKEIVEEKNPAYCFAHAGDLPSR